MSKTNLCLLIFKTSYKKEKKPQGLRSGLLAATQGVDLKGFSFTVIYCNLRKNEQCFNFM